MLIFEDLLRRTVGNQMALAHYVGALTHGQRFTNVVVRDQYAKPAVAQVLNDTFDIDNGDGVNARKRFIQQDEFWVCCQRARNLNAAAFTTGQRLAEAVTQMLDETLPSARSHGQCAARWSDRHGSGARPSGCRTRLSGGK